MTYSAYLAYAEAAGFVARENPFVGLSDPATAGLRCFRRYSREATVDITDPEGRTRWLSQKQSRIYAILDRDSSNGNRVLKMKDIASEAMVSTSTVSRTVVKLQAFGLFAIDVIRGRLGGIRVRKRRLGDNLRHYATAAWDKLKRRVQRAQINVASVFSLSERGTTTTEVPTWVMDATFTEAWDDAERRGAELLRDARRADASIAPLGRDPEGLAPSADRVRAWVRGVLDERIRLDQEAPDWDLVLENVRASYGMTSRWPQ